MTTEKFTDEEYMKISEDYLAAKARGDEAEEIRLMRLFPLGPYMAKVGRDIFGKNYLIDNGYDLSLANEKFGEDWLDREFGWNDH